jgi:tRNA A37 threonylcarbamoyladenosine dehydratase
LGAVWQTIKSKGYQINDKYLIFKIRLQLFCSFRGRIYNYKKALDEVNKMHEQFARTEMLIGRSGIEVLKKSRVAIFGIGGVGSFVAEGLARAGVGHFLLVDHDIICLSNINRQIHAVHSTVGMAKTEVMKKRILDINPEAEVKDLKIFYSPESAHTVDFENYDYVVDAVDCVTAKIDLALQAKAKNIPVISSMGAGNKLDPCRFQVADIYETTADPLARVMRRELRKRNIDSLKVVYSTETPIKIQEEEKKSVPGSISFVPSVAGLIIAGEVIKDLIGYKR